MCVKHLNRCKTSTCCCHCASVFHFPLFQSSWSLCFFKPLCHFNLSFIAGGKCTTDSHCPTKTLSVRGDTEPDQLCVPASFSHSHLWPPAKPRTGMSIFQTVFSMQTQTFGLPLDVTSKPVQFSQSVKVGMIWFS